jgi:8-amino-7-oxononanoate synthase
MGLAELKGLQHRIAFQMGTLSKSAGLSGGYLAASQDWIDLLTNRARSFIYSTAPPPALAHAALTSLAVIRSTEGHSLREKLRVNISLMTSGNSPIIPHILGSNEAALAASHFLEQAGFLVPAIRYPTVPHGKSRLRISLSAAHLHSTVEELKNTISSLNSSRN